MGTDSSGAIWWLWKCFICCCIGVSAKTNIFYNKTGLMMESMDGILSSGLDEMQLVVKYPLAVTEEKVDNCTSKARSTLEKINGQVADLAQKALKSKGYKILVEESKEEKPTFSVLVNDQPSTTVATTTRSSMTTSETCSCKQTQCVCEKLQAGSVFTHKVKITNSTFSVSVRGSFADQSSQVQTSNGKLVMKINENVEPVIIYIETDGLFSSVFETKFAGQLFAASGRISNTTFFSVKYARTSKSKVLPISLVWQATAKSRKRRLDTFLGLSTVEGTKNLINQAILTSNLLEGISPGDLAEMKAQFQASSKALALESDLFNSFSDKMCSETSNTLIQVHTNHMLTNLNSFVSSIELDLLACGQNGRITLSSQNRHKICLLHLGEVAWRQVSKSSHM